MSSLARWAGDLLAHLLERGSDMAAKKKAKKSARKTTVQLSSQKTKDRARVLIAMRDRVIPPPKDLPEKVERFRNDPQFSFAIRVLLSLVKSRPLVVKFEGMEEDDRTEVLTQNIQKMWRRSIRHVFEAVEWGRAALEWRKSYDSANDLQLISFVGYLPYQWTTPYFDPYGQLDFMRVGEDKLDENNEPLYIDIQSGSLWLSTIDASPEYPVGKSRYLGAPERVLAERESNYDNRSKWYRKHAVGISVAKAPGSYTEGDDSYQNYGTKGEQDMQGRIEDPIQDLQALLEQVDGGGVVIMPSGQFLPEDGGGQKYEFQDVAQVKDSTPIENRNQTLDIEALRSLGIPENSLTLTDVGSLAASKTYLQVLWDVAQEILEQLVEAYQKQVVNKLAWANFGSSVTMTLSTPPIGDSTEEDARALVKQIIAAPQLNPLIVAGFVDFAKLLELSGIPAGGDLAAAMQKVESLAAPPAAPARFSARLEAAPAPPTPPGEEELLSSLNDKLKVIRQQVADLLDAGETVEQRHL